ncbi:MAG: hypothetical protein K0R57_2506 [Paenibacillaceae bacterium]|jgi:hypothetical protein|nr:hypothetical protein [Paenibacillaceae bacterium]
MLSSTCRSIWKRLFTFVLFAALISPSIALSELTGNVAYADSGPVAASFTPADLSAAAQSDAQRLHFDLPLKDIVSSSDGANLFAVTGDNQLVRIETSSMTVGERNPVGSYLSSMVIDGDKLYLGFQYNWTIKRFDTQGGTTVNGSVYSWTTQTSVSQVVYGNNQLYYTSPYTPGAVYAIDLESGLTTTHNTQNRNAGRMVIDPVESSLFYMESHYNYGEILKYNLQDWSLLAASTNHNSHYASALDGDSFYSQSWRLDRNTLQPISPQSKYGDDSIVSVHGTDVIGRTYVWDKDTYTKKFTLPFPVQKMLVLPNGQIILVSENGTTLAKYASMEALRNSSPEYTVPELQISNLSFSDSNPINGIISGMLQWDALPGNSLIDSYTVYQLDQNLNKIGAAILEVPYSNPTRHYSVSLANISLAPAAKHLSVYTKNANGESTSAATVPLTDQGVSNPPAGGGGGYISYIFRDLDPARGQILPLVSWILSDETKYSGYRLSFADEAGTMLGYDDFEKHDIPEVVYQVSVSADQVPPTAVFMDLRPKDLNGNVGVSLYRMQIFDSTLGSGNRTAVNSSIPAPNIIAGSFEDYDYSPGSINGSMYWNEASSTTSAATAYHLYFVDANNVKLKPIAEIKRSHLIGPNLNLPAYEVTLPGKTPVPAGAQRIGIFGSNAQGEGTAGHYFGLWDEIESDAGHNFFEDQNGRAGQIDGIVRWLPATDEQNISYYQVEFLNAWYLRVGGVFTHVNKGLPQYEASIPGSQIPGEASMVLVTAVNTTNDSFTIGSYGIADNIADETATALPMNGSIPNGSIPDFIDYDGDLHEIGGYFGFVNTTITGNNRPLRYDVYFVNDALEKIKPVISLTENERGMHSTSIPWNTPVPEGATKLAVFPVTASKEGVPTAIAINDRGYSPSLTQQQIQIVNNKTGTSDTVTVTGLQRGDNVRVYRTADSGNPFLSQIMMSSSSSTTFNIDQLGTQAGKLYVTLQRGSGLPSSKLEVAYEAEPTTAPPAGGGGFGGGGGGGGGAAAVEAKPAKNADGKMAYEIKPDRGGLLSSLNSGDKELQIDATVEEKLDLLTVELDSDIVLRASSLNRPLVIKSSDITLKFAPNALDIKDSKGTVRLNIAFATQNIPDFSVVSPIMDIVLSQGDAAITSFNNPVQATFAYDQESVKNWKNLGVYVLDEQTGHWERIGGTVNGDGTITAKLPHLSRYAVLEKAEQGISFADIQGHWAQKEIEQLAKARIVDGMDENSFMPEANLTRAQFVTLIAKAFKLESHGTAGTFADISGDSWYKDAVYAAYEAGIVEGVSEQAFAPDDNITREQLAVMVVKAYLHATGKKLADIAEPQETVFPDASSISDWAKPYVGAATELGLLQGDDQGFAPAVDSSRAQAAVVISRLLAKAAK